MSQLARNSVLMASTVCIPILLDRLQRPRQGTASRWRTIRIAVSRRFRPRMKRSVSAAVCLLALAACGPNAQPAHVVGMVTYQVSGGVPGLGPEPHGGHERP